MDNKSNKIKLTKTNKYMQTILFSVKHLCAKKLANTPPVGNEASSRNYEVLKKSLSFSDHLGQLTLRRGYAALFVLLLSLTAGVGNVWGATVTYTITSKNTLSTTGTAPAGSSATLYETSSTSKQMISTTSQTLELTGYGDAVITNITLSMHSNTKSGAGSLSYSTNSGVAGSFVFIVGSASTGETFSNSSWNGGWSTSYVPISKNVNIQCVSEKKVVIYILATANSLYCESYTITYVNEKYTVTYDTGSGEPIDSEMESKIGSGVVLPTPTLPTASVEKGWEFAGWKQTSAQTSTTTAPTLLAAGTTYHPQANETLYAVYKFTEPRENCTAGQLMDTGDLSVGDLVVLYNETNTNQFNGVSSSIGVVTSYSTTPAETHILRVEAGKSSGQFAFYDTTDENYLSYSGSSNQLLTADEVTDNSSWTVSISSGNATITNVAVTSRLLYYNHNGGTNPRFACYTSSQSLPQLYKMCPPIVTYNSDCVFDYFVDVMHGDGNVIKDKTQQGTYTMPAAPSYDKPSPCTYCEEKHYKFIGWVDDAHVDSDGTLLTGYSIVSGGTTSWNATGTTYYAIWAKEL